jgi:hypothetical protein
MAVLPFQISPEAEAIIREKLVAGRQEEDLRAMCASLYVALSYEERDGEGTITEKFQGAFFDIGWYCSAEVSEGRGFHKFEFIGHELFIHIETLALLEGKRLTVQTVDVGYPTPSEKQASLLRCCA